MDHHHNPYETNNHGRAFITGILLNLIFIAVEIIFGYISNSMALLSDAVHNFSDVMALGFSWIAILISQRKPDLKYTYGLRRSTILAALLNTILLLASVVYIIYETISRIGSGSEIKSGYIIVVAAAGIIINGLTAWLFATKRTDDLNIRSVFLHFIADTLVSLGVVISGLLIALTGIRWIDSFVSLAVAAIILYTTYKLLIRSINLSLDAVPENIDINAVRGYFEELPGISGIHDLHVWSLSTTEAALTVHIITRSQTDPGFLKGIQNDLKTKFNIGHSTIQVEISDQPGECNNCN